MKYRFHKFPHRSKLHERKETEMKASPGSMVKIKMVGSFIPSVWPEGFTRRCHMGTCQGHSGHCYGISCVSLGLLTPPCLKMVLCVKLVSPQIQAALRRGHSVAEGPIMGMKCDLIPRWDKVGGIQGRLEFTHHRAGNSRSCRIHTSKHRIMRGIG